MELDRHHDDSPGFIDFAERVLHGLDSDWGYDVCYAIRIKGWFDHKWLRFAGVGRVPFDTSLAGHPGVVLDPFWTNSKKRSTRAGRLTVPPFSPKRVLETKRWVAQDAVGVSKALPHRRVLDHSSFNIHRPLSNFATDACLVWYSSGSGLLQRASLMAYMIRGGCPCEPFFLALSCADSEEWVVSLSKGISLHEVARLQDGGAACAVD